MNTAQKRTLYFLVGLVAIAISACGASTTATPDGLSGVYTSVAETTTAQAAIPSLTPFPSLTALDTLVPVPNATDTPDVSSTVTATPVPLSNPTAVIPQGGCDNATYVSDVTIPDHTVVVAGATFQKTWSLLNSGSCPWTTSYKLTFVSGEQMGGVATALTASVAAGQKANVSVSLTAPTTAGEYTSRWRLANAQGTAFGDLIYLLINVSTSTTVTPTVTPTGSTVALTATRTITPSGPTKTPTHTPVGPTSTPRPTSPAPTNTPSLTPLVPTPTPTFTLPAPTDTPTPTPTTVPPTPTPTITPTP